MTRTETIQTSHGTTPIHQAHAIRMSGSSFPYQKDLLQQSKEPIQTKKFPTNNIRWPSIMGLIKERPVFDHRKSQHNQNLNTSNDNIKKKKKKEPATHRNATANS